MADPLQAKPAQSIEAASDLKVESSLTVDLTAREEQFRRLIEFRNGESWHDPSGRLLWVSASIERLTGYPVADCLTMFDYPLPFVVVKYRPIVCGLFEEAREPTGESGATGHIISIQIRTRSGELRGMEFSWQALHDQDGEWQGFRTTLREADHALTKVSHADENASREEVLAQSEHGYLRSVLDRHAGNVSQAARAEGMSRQGFYKLLQKHRLVPREFRRGE